MIALAVLLEIIILFAYPKHLVGNSLWLLLVHPIAWALLFGMCGYGTLASPWFSFAMILQGFNCAGVVLVQRKVGMHWMSVSGQAAVTFSQGAGWLTANFFDAFVLSGNQQEVWQNAWFFAVASVLVGGYACWNFTRPVIGRRCVRLEKPIPHGLWIEIWLLVSFVGVHGRDFLVAIPVFEYEYEYRLRLSTSTRKRT